MEINIIIVIEISCTQSTTPQIVETFQACSPYMRKFLTISRKTFLPVFLKTHKSVKLTQNINIQNQLR